MKPLETLRALGTGSEAPVEARERVYSALLASLAVGATAAGTAGAMAKASASLPPAPVPLVAGVAGSKAAAIAVGMWLIGGVTGAALYGALRTQEVRVVYVDRPAAVVASAVTMRDEAVPSVSASQTATAAPSASAVRIAVAGSSSAAADSVTSQLSRERALLDLARNHAAHGEPALVLTRVEQHRKQFPRGRLAEERDALAIRALQALGRGDEARLRADAFRTAYPHSFLTPMIDSALSAP